MLGGTKGGMVRRLVHQRRLHSQFQEAARWSDLPCTGLPPGVRRAFFRGGCSKRLGMQACTRTGGWRQTGAGGLPAYGMCVRCIIECQHPLPACVHWGDVAAETALASIRQATGLGARARTTGVKGASVLLTVCCG